MAAQRRAPAALTQLMAILTVTLPLLACGQSTAEGTSPALPRLDEIHVPPGFVTYAYAWGLNQPTAMAFGPDGRLYVSQASGEISVVPSRASMPRPLVRGLPIPVGLAWRSRNLYVSVKGSVLAYRLVNGGLARLPAVVTGLPVGQHFNDNLILMPNGDFLLGLGSPCDVCSPPDVRSASVLRFDSNWSFRGVMVRGTRNPYGLALRASTGAAYVTINGQNNLGKAEPADHMLKVVEGEDAGWPRCWPSFRDRTLHGDCAGAAVPVALFPPHSSADGILFYDGKDFPASYRDNVFVAEFGAQDQFTTGVSANAGRRVVRIVLTGSGINERGRVTDFATGFSHPLGLAIAPDGGLLIADYGTGIITEVKATG